MNPDQDWTWTDEERVLRTMPLRTLDRYITSVVWRARDFRGAPITSAWLETFRARAEQIKAFRERVHA